MGLISFLLNVIVASVILFAVLWKWCEAFHRETNWWDYDDDKSSPMP